MRRPKAAKDGTDADFFGVTLFGRPAEIVNQYSAKGKRISVSGRLQLDEWGEGDNRNARVLVIAEHVTIIDWPPQIHEGGWRHGVARHWRHPRGSCCGAGDGPSGDSVIARWRRFGERFEVSCDCEVVRSRTVLNRSSRCEHMFAMVDV